MILVLGCHGQLGRALERNIGPSSEHVFLNRNSTNYCGDITNTRGIADTLMALKPEVIINAAAHTDVDGAEDKPEVAMAVNGYAVSVIAQIAAKLGAIVVHYSSDYVFNGNGSHSWKETDHCSPLSVYGKSKLLGEEAIRTSGAKHFILRTSWIYSADGQNFLTTVLKRAEIYNSLQVVSDQWGTPTHVDYVAETTIDLINRSRPGFGGVNRVIPEWGIYHCTPSGWTTRFDFAQFVISTAKSYGAATQCQSILATSSAEYASKAARPANSRLSNVKLQSTLGKSPPNWRDQVIETVYRAIAHRENVVFDKKTQRQ